MDSIDRPPRDVSPLRLVRPVRLEANRLVVIDQTSLPFDYVERELTSIEEVARAIETLVVRGAPLIGVVAGYGLALEARQDCSPDSLAKAIDRLGTTRPTARNLFAALERVHEVITSEPADAAEAIAIEAKRLHEEDLRASSAIARRANAVFPRGGWALTICNTGALATGGGGTALGLIVEGYRQGLVDGVYVCETRPLLQGARLTAWELDRIGVPFRVLPDSAAASLMITGEVCAVAVGADRIARNGDTANKVGTRMLACLANAAGLPFLVVAPRSTFDPATASGDHIPIEQRAANEVRSLGGINVMPTEFPVYNPSFDVTEASLISRFVTDVGVFTVEELEVSDIWS